MTRPACDTSTTCALGRRFLGLGNVETLLRRFPKFDKHGMCWVVAAARHGQCTLDKLRPYAQQFSKSAFIHACHMGYLPAAKRLHATFECVLTLTELHALASMVIHADLADMLQWLLDITPHMKTSTLIDLWRTAYQRRSLNCAMCLTPHALRRLPSNDLIKMAGRRPPLPPVLGMILETSSPLNTDSFVAAAAAGRLDLVESFCRAANPSWVELERALHQACVTGQLHVVQALWNNEKRSCYLMLDVACSNNRAEVAAWILDNMHYPMYAAYVSSTLLAEMWGHTDENTLRCLHERGLLPRPSQETLFAACFTFPRSRPRVIAWAVGCGFLDAATAYRWSFMTCNRELFALLRSTFPELVHHELAARDVDEFLNSFKLTVPTLQWMLRYARPTESAVRARWEAYGWHRDHVRVNKVLVRHGLVRDVRSRRKQLAHMLLKECVARTWFMMRMRRLVRGFFS